MEKMLTPTEAANQLQVSTSLLGQMRYRGVGPRYVKVSPRKVFYRQHDLDAYVESVSRQGTAAAS